MMSPYSSFFREQLWGGIPVSLWSLAVFAFLAYRGGPPPVARAGDLRARRRCCSSPSLLPVAMSVVYGALSVAKLDALCKVCIGIYAASAICLRRRAARTPREGGDLPRRRRALRPRASRRARASSWRSPSRTSLLAPRPDPKASLLGCGSLVRAEDTAGVDDPALPERRRRLRRRGARPALPLLQGLRRAARGERARRPPRPPGRAVPARLHLQLDGDRGDPPRRLRRQRGRALRRGRGRPARRTPPPPAPSCSWAFARQARAPRPRREPTSAALRAEIEREFPAVKGCLGGALVKSKLTKSLRWAVANADAGADAAALRRRAAGCATRTPTSASSTRSRACSRPRPQQERARRRAAAAAPRRVPAGRDPACGGAHAARGPRGGAAARPGRRSRPPRRRRPPRGVRRPRPPAAGAAPSPRGGGAAGRPHRPPRSRPRSFRRGDPAMNDTSKRWILLAAALAIPLALVVTWALGGPLPARGEPGRGPRGGDGERGERRVLHAGAEGDRAPRRRRVRAPRGRRRRAAAASRSRRRRSPRSPAATSTRSSSRSRTARTSSSSTPPRRSSTPPRGRSSRRPGATSAARASSSSSRARARTATSSTTRR